MALQMDQKNLYAEEFLDMMMAQVAGITDQHSELFTVLDRWDRVDSAEEAAPLLFHKWMRQLPDTLFEKQFPEDVYQMLPGKNHMTDAMLRQAAEGEEGAWVSEYGGTAKWLSDSLDTALAEITADQGGDPAGWEWGAYHQLTFPHPVAGASPVLEALLNPDKVPIGGSNITVQAAAFTDEGDVDHGASWRFVADLSDLTKAYHIVGPGLSGHMKSEFYHNQVEDWAQGDFHETMIRGDIDGATLTLTPE